MMQAVSIQKRRHGYWSWLALVGLTLGLCLGCKHGKSGSDFASVDSYTRHAVDVAMLNRALVQSDHICRQNLVSLYANAIADGLLVNGAWTGLGTDYPMGKKLKTDSLYFQAMRIFSIFDWEISQDLLKDNAIVCYPEELSFGFGVLSRDYVQGLSRPFAEDVARFKAALRTLTSDAPDFQVVEASNLQKPAHWPEASDLSAALRSAMLSGSLHKLRYIKSASAQNESQKEKIKAIAAAFNPLQVNISAQFPRNHKSRSMIYTEAYLPAPSELATPNVDDARSWSLTPGIARRPLPRVVDVSVARLTHIAYLEGASPSTHQVIKLQMLKDLRQPDKLYTRVVFGEIKPGEQDSGAIPVGYKDPKGSLIISFVPALAAEGNDSSIVRAAKNLFNDTFNHIRIDARIHQLSIDFSRIAGANPLKEGPDAVMLRPHFDLKGSDISFKVYIPASGTTEVSAYQVAGFECVNMLCTQEFNTFKEMNDYLLGDEVNGPGALTLKAKIADKIKGMLDYLIKQNTKFLINWNIKSIESALDQQFEQILSDVLDQQIDTRAKMRTRLERLIE